MFNIEEKIELTKDCTRDFVDAAYFIKLMKSLKYFTHTRIDITHVILMFEDLSSRKRHTVQNCYKL